ncbi:borealin-2-like isoform X2 [Amblyraja radiata]|uniref:borealin-2-like isoform X1 n=1 Tax=Amblyraja radiata TaxID=386614 RepID=UPI001402D898|nr:borealin-2-like isoform X1 [Amblyraja radiata]XP_032892301.1 borealin-2-like isoform X2 [Amblyraja radiata]
MATKSCTVAKAPPTKPRSFTSRDKETLIRRIGPKTSQCLHRPRVNRSLPMIKIPLADGQAISAAGEEVNNIDVQSLDPQTLQGIQLLVTRLTALCEKAQNSAKHANSI